MSRSLRVLAAMAALLFGSVCAAQALPPSDNDSRKPESYQLPPELVPVQPPLRPGLLSIDVDAREERRTPIYVNEGPRPAEALTWMPPEPKRRARPGGRGIGYPASDKAPGPVTGEEWLPQPKIWGTVSPSYDSITFDLNATLNGGSLFIPPDSNAAVGPNHIITVTNAAIQIRNKTTGTLNLSQSLQGFFTSLGPVNATFDPKVFYDDQANRFVLVTLELIDSGAVSAANTSFAYVAVSQTSDPTGTWFRTKITTEQNIGGADCWGDYPGFGADDEAVYLSLNMFQFDAGGGLFCATRLFIVTKGVAGGFYGGGAAVFSVVDPYPAPPPTNFDMTTQPARIRGTQPTAPAGTFLVGYNGLASTSPGTTEFLQITRIDSPIGTPVLTNQIVSMGNIAANPPPAPADAVQPGGVTALDAGDLRALDAVWRGNELWTVFTHSPASGEATAHWVRLNAPATGTISVTGQADITGEDIGVGVRTFYPAISVNDRDAVVVGFSASSSAVFAGAYAVSRRDTDASTVMSSPPTLIKAGVASYVRTFGGGNNRWGDYSAVATDPTDQCFWVYNQWATTQGTPTSGGEVGRWATTAGRVCVCEGNEANGDANLDGICDLTATTTVLTDNNDPSVFGQTVTFTATVSGTGGTPTGTVNFLDGATALGSGTLSGGVATLNTAALAVGGPRNITANYLGDTAFAASSGIQAHTINRANTTTGLTSSVNPSVFGQSVTFTATVTATAPGTGVPTGTVTFFDGAANIGTGTLNASGVATLATSTLSVAAHSITAQYAQTTNYNASTSSAVTQTVNRANTSTALTSSVNPSVFGQPVTFTATVSSTAPGGGTPSGTVTFFDGAANIGTGTLNAAGVATLATSALSVAAHSITAQYAQTTNYNASTSSAVTQTVDRANTSTALTSSVNPSVFGQPVTFTATVTATAPGGGTPSGTVTFFDGAANIGTGTLNAAGVATLATSTLSVAAHSITAQYAQSANHNASTSSAVTQTVNRANTTTGLTSSVNPSVFGQSVTFTATVSATAPGGGTPSGTVTFFDGAANIGSGTLNAAGVATLATSTLSVAAHSITAQYAQTTNYNASTSSAVTQTVNRADTTTTLVAAPDPSVFGQSVTLTATVAATLPGTGTPSGTVTFFDGAANIGSGTLNASGVATLATTTLSVASHSLTAQYAQTTNYNASTSTADTQTVNRADTTTTLVAAPDPSVFGQSVTLTATVAAVAPGSGTPTGTVTFFDGAANIGTGTLNAAGVATLATTTLSVAAHSLTAQYAQTASYNASTSTADTQTVNRSDTTTIVSGAPDPSVFGQSVTFTATVTATAPGGGTPSGTVTFFDGAANIGTGTLNAAGVATLATSALAIGSHSVTAQYAQTASYNASTSVADTQTVNRASTTTTLVAAPDPSVFGQSVTLTATVTAVAPGTGTPTGTVTFFDGAANIGTGTLTAGVATLATTTLSVGAHSLTAQYAQTTNYDASTSTADTQTVNRASTTTTVVAAPDPSVFGQSVTLTATVASVAPGTGTPSGTVTFFDGAANIGSGTLNASGVATLATSALSVGSHSLTAQYAQTTNYSASTSSADTQTVNRAATTLSLVSAPDPSLTGQLVVLTATVQVVAPGSGTPTGSVEFFDGAASLGTATVGVGGIATLSTSALTTGSHTLNATYGITASFEASNASDPHTVIGVDLMFSNGFEDP